MTVPIPHRSPLPSGQLRGKGHDTGLGHSCTVRSGQNPGLKGHDHDPAPSGFPVAFLGHSQSLGVQELCHFIQGAHSSQYVLSKTLSPPRPLYVRGWGQEETCEHHPPLRLKEAGTWLTARPEPSTQLAMFTECRDVLNSLKLSYV